jgi:hypothetical protein
MNANQSLRLKLFFNGFTQADAAMNTENLTLKARDESESRVGDVLRHLRRIGKYLHPRIGTMSLDSMDGRERHNAVQIPSIGQERDDVADGERLMQRVMVKAFKQAQVCHCHDTLALTPTTRPSAQLFSPNELGGTSRSKQSGHGRAVVLPNTVPSSSFLQRSVVIIVASITALTLCSR